MLQPLQVPAIKPGSATRAMSCSGYLRQIEADPVLPANFVSKTALKRTMGRQSPRGAIFSVRSESTYPYGKCGRRRSLARCSEYTDPAIYVNGFTGSTKLPERSGFSQGDCMYRCAHATPLAATLMLLLLDRMGAEVCCGVE
jgi:hypothetical protein